MNKTVPSPTNWPEQRPRRNKKKIHAIDWTPDGSAISDLTHHFRAVRRGDYGKVRAYIMTTIDGQGNERYFTHHVGGQYHRDELQQAAKRLRKFIDTGGSLE